MDSIATKFKVAQTVSVNDMTRRLGYSGGSPNLAINPKYSGLTSACVPGGKLLLFAPGLEKWLGAYDDFKKVYPTQSRVISPAELQTNVRRKFFEGNDTGYRDLDCLTHLKHGLVEREVDGKMDTVYLDEADQYFDTIHPKISCEFGLEAPFTSGAAGNVGAKWYQPCPTCRLASLKGADVDKRINDSVLDKTVLFKLRDALIEANEATIRFATRQVTDINADIEKRANGEPQGRTTRNDADYIYLKMIHKTLEKKESTVDVGAIVAAAVAAVKAQTPDFDREAFEKWKAEEAVLAVQAKQAAAKLAEENEPARRGRPKKEEVSEVVAEEV